MHSTQVPSDDDLQQYPHVFFTSSDIWDASVLDHGTTPALLKEIHHEDDDSLIKDSIFMNFDIFTNEWYSTWMFLGLKPNRDWGSLISCSSS